MRNDNPVAPGEVTNDQLLEYQYPNDVVGMTITCIGQTYNYNDKGVLL